MSCCGTPYAGINPNFPPVPLNPRQPPRPTPTHRVENGRLVRKGGFAQQQGRRMLAIARDPRIITFRELVAAGFLAWTLWQLAVDISKARDHIAAASALFCRPYMSRIGCWRVYWRVSWWAVREWIGDCIIWLPFVAMVVVAAEVMGVDRLFL